MTICFFRQSTPSSKAGHSSDLGILQTNYDTNEQVRIMMNSSGRTFAYCRILTTEQSPENQVIAIRSRSYDVTDSRAIA